MSQIIKNMPKIDEWHSKYILKKFDNIGWNDSIKKLHEPENIGNLKKTFIKDSHLMKFFQLF